MKKTELATRLFGMVAYIAYRFFTVLSWCSTQRNMTTSSGVTPQHSKDWASHLHGVPADYSSYFASILPLTCKQHIISLPYLWVAIKGCKRQVLVDLVVIAINYNTNLRSLDQIHINAIYSQVTAVIPTNLKFILIICFRALNPHSPFSPSSSKTWKRRIFKTIFIKTLFKLELFKIHTSHTCPFPPLCSLQSNVWLCPVLQFYSFLVLLKKWVYLLSFHNWADVGRVNTIVVVVAV